MADAADGGVALESSPSARVADRQSGRGLRSGFCVCRLVVVDVRNDPEKFQQLVTAVVQKFSVYTVFREVRIVQLLICAVFRQRLLNSIPSTLNIVSVST